MLLKKILISRGFLRLQRKTRKSLDSAKFVLVLVSGNIQVKIRGCLDCLKTKGVFCDITTVKLYCRVAEVNEILSFKHQFSFRSVLF